MFCVTGKRVLYFYLASKLTLKFSAPGDWTVLYLAEASEILACWYRSANQATRDHFRLKKKKEMNKDKRAMRPVWKLPNDKFKLLNKKCFLYLWKKKSSEENHGLWKCEVNNNIFRSVTGKMWSD